MPRSAIRTVAVTAIVFVAITAAAVSAAPGDLDLSFSTDGIVEVDFGAVSQEFRNGEPHGSKIVAVGEADDDFAIARLRAGGGYDDGFAGNGRKTVDFGNEDVAYGLAVHPDGRISVVGSADDAKGDARLAVATLKRGGGLDPSFNDDGLVTTRSPDGFPVFGYDAVVQPDGKLVVSGETYDGGPGRFFAARFKANGKLDRTFSGDGKVVVNLGQDEDGAWRVALTSDGRIVLAGWSVEGGDYRTAVVRLLPNGRLDRTFSKDGIRVMDLSPADNDHVYGLAVTADDEIVLGVNLYANGSFDPHVVKLTRSGKFDSSFGGGDGRASNFADGFQMVDLDIRSDGRIVGVLRATNIASFLLDRRGVPVGGYGLSGLNVTSTPMIATAMFADAKDRPVLTGVQVGDPYVIRLQR